MNTNTNPNLRREHIVKYYIGHSDGERYYAPSMRYKIDRDMAKICYEMERLFSTENEAIAVLEKAYNHNENDPDIDSVYYIYRQEVLNVFKGKVLLSREEKIVLQCSFDSKKEKVGYIF